MMMTESTEQLMAQTEENLEGYLTNMRRLSDAMYYDVIKAKDLSGENLDGSTSQLVFYSSRGLERIRDLTGGGADHDPCGGHSGKA